MATPEPLKKQTFIKQSGRYKILKDALKHKKIEAIHYDSVLEHNAIYTLSDKDAQEFYLIPKATMQTLMQEIKSLESDKYLFKLEQEIYKNMPVDFDDVWCVALKEIKDYKKEPRVVVKGLKKRYPYLFLSFLGKFDSSDKL